MDYGWEYSGIDIESEIRIEAYFLWLNAGCPPDRQIEFWLEAERKILKEKNERN